MKRQIASEITIGNFVMLIEERKTWSEGKSLWYEYVNLNGYSFKPNDDGLKKLSKMLDLNIDYLRKRITFYLDN